MMKRIVCSSVNFSTAIIGGNLEVFGGERVSRLSSRIIGGNTEVFAGWSMSKVSSRLIRLKNSLVL